MSASAARAQVSAQHTGLVLALGSWAMLFGALFFSYAMVRQRAAVWPPDDVPTLKVTLPALSTGLLALSSLTLAFARERRRWLGLAALLGTAFLGLQLTCWLLLLRAGLVPSAGPYAAAVFALTWAHAAHAAVGTGGLWWAAFTARVRWWEAYWHFMAAVWVLLFFALFIL